MEHEEASPRSRLYVWVHTCPQRIHSLDALMGSLASSDVGEFDLRCHEIGLPWEKIKIWWAEQWTDVAAQAKERGAKFVLRLEDDIVVGRHLVHNVVSWPALELPDFGVGLLYLDDSMIEQLSGLEVEAQTGAMRTTLDHAAFAQAQVVPTELCETLASRSLRATEALRRTRVAVDLDFDCGFTHVAHHLGKRMYFHVPSLVQTTELSNRSELTEQIARSHTARRTWKPDWRRPDGRLRDVEAEHLWGYETRWAVLNDGGSGFVSPVRCTPNPTEPQLVNWQGRSIVMSPERLFATPEAAEEARQSLRAR